VEAALAWVENTGIATSWSVVSTLPCLSRALAPGANHQIVWQVQEELPRSRRGHYGKFLAGKGAVASLEMLLDLLTLAGGPDIGRQWASGRLSRDAVGISQILADAGPVRGDELRKRAGLSGKNDARRFEAAMSELQQLLLIAATDQIQGNGRFKIPVWDLTARSWAQELLPAADEGHALRRTVRGLASACGLLREGDLRSWLKPWGHDPASVLRELSESGDVEAFAVTAGSVVYVTTAARPEAERALEEEPR
jgi:hypothetical protein